MATRTAPFNIGQPQDRDRGWMTSGGQNATTATEMQDYMQKLVASIPNAAQYARHIAQTDPRNALLNRSLTAVERADMYTLENVITREVERQITLLTAYKQSFWLDLAPITPVTGNSYQWDGIVVKAGLPSDTPLHTRSRLVSVEAYAGGTTLTRVSRGLSISLDMLKKGVHRGQELLSTMAAAVLESLNSGRALRIVQAIIGVLFNTSVYFGAKEVWTNMSMDTVIRNRREFTWGSRKLRNPLPVTTDYMIDLMKAQNVETSGLVLLLHHHTNSVLKIKPDRLEYNKSGVPREGWEENTASAFTVDGVAPRVYIVEPMTGGAEIMDPMILSHTMGLMAPIIDYEHATRPGLYDASLRTRELFNVAENCWFPVTIEEARLRSDRWDPETGNLNSFKNPSVWSHLPLADQDKYKQGDDMWMCPDTGRAAAMLGSAPQFDSAHFINSIKPLLAKFGQEATSRYESAIDGLMQVTALIEAQPLPATETNALIAAIAALGVGPLTRGVAAPFTPCLNFTGDEYVRSPDGFLGGAFLGGGASIGTFNKAVWDLPPFLGSYAGLRFLWDQSANLGALKAQNLLNKLGAWLDDFDELAKKLSRPFGLSVAMNPAYATGEWSAPSFESMLFDFLIPNRTPLWVLASSAAVPSRSQLTQLESARKSILVHPDMSEFAGNALYNANPAAAAGFSAAEILLYVAGQVFILSMYLKLAKTDELKIARAAYEALVSSAGYKPIALRDMAKRLFSNKDSLDYADSVIGTLDSASKSGGVGTKFYRTPLWVGPSQLAAVVANANTTISDPKNRDLPFSAAESAAFLANQAELRNSGYSDPLSNRPQMMNGQMFKRAGHMTQVVQRFGQRSGQSTDIDFIRSSLGLMRTTGNAARRVSTATMASSTALDWMAQLGAQPSSSSGTPLASDYGGTTDQIRSIEFKRYFGCADPAVVHGVNSVFITTFNRMVSYGVSPLHQLLARVMMSMPTNLSAINQMEGGGVPLADNYVILRALNYMSAAVVVLKAGKETLQLCVDSAGPLVTWGVQPLTEMYFVHAAEQLAVAVVQPKNICVQADFDPMSYLGGMTSEWRDLDAHARLPNSKTAGDMICVAIPAGTKCMPSYWTPTGVIKAMSSSASGYIPTVKTSMNNESFEALRLGWDKPGHLAPVVPRTYQAGNHISPSFFTDLYHLDCVRVPRATDKSVVWKRISADTIIPRHMYKPSLRSFINGPVASANMIK